MDCKLNEPPFFQCCCNCKSHFKLFNENIKDTGKWVCTLFINSPYLEEHPGVIESEEHSVGCECYYENT